MQDLGAREPKVHTLEKRSKVAYELVPLGRYVLLALGQFTTVKFTAGQDSLPPGSLSPDSLLLDTLSPSTVFDWTVCQEELFVK